MKDSKNSCLLFKRCAFPTLPEQIQATSFSLFNVPLTKAEKSQCSIIGYWNNYHLIAFPSDQCEENLVKVFFFTKTGHDRTRTIMMEPQDRAAVFGEHYFISLAPDGKGLLWDLKNPHHRGTTARISQAPRTGQSTDPKTPYEISVCRGNLYVMKDQRLSHLVARTKRYESSLEVILLLNLAETKPGFQITSFDVLGKKLSLLCVDQDKKSHVYVGSLPSSEGQEIDSLGDWFEVEGCPSEVKLASDYILLFGHHHGEDYPTTIKVLTVKIDATITLETHAEIRHGKSVIKDIASYVPTFLKGAVESATSYFQSSIQGFTIFCSERFGNTPYIVSFNESIRVFELDGKEINFGQHFLGQGLKQYLKSNAKGSPSASESPITILGIQAISEADELAIFWKQDLRKDAAQHVSFLKFMALFS